MSVRLDEVKDSADRLERMVRALVADRERAWAEVARLKQALDDRELEFLQADEESQKEIQRLGSERSEIERERDESARQMEEIAAKIRDIIPLLPEIDSVEGRVEC